MVISSDDEDAFSNRTRKESSGFTRYFEKNVTLFHCIKLLQKLCEIVGTHMVRSEFHLLFQLIGLCQTNAKNEYFVLEPFIDHP